MDDLIPFLIVIAISIIGSVARKKRKRETAQNITSIPQNKKSDDLFSWLEKFTEVEEQAIPYQQKVSDDKTAIPEKKQEITIKEFLANQAAIKKEKEASAKQKQKDTTPTSDLTKTLENQKEIKLKQNFNLKKAVIYSEILNRKYI